MSEQIFDLVIIGGGINGAGVARDAALRGLSVALIEAEDFASGTSSRSSKLIHGGIRYLENFEFKLVFEALSERKKLFEMAPHLVHPLRFMIPIYKSSRVGMFKMGLGMWLYDALSLFQAPKLHERLSAVESLARMPSLQPDGLLGSYVYSDAYMDDDRLVFETLRSAAEAGALAVNYVKALGADFGPDQKIKAVRCRDQMTDKEISLRARHVVSTVGPWTDEVGSNLLKGWKKILRPTKGIHLTFEKSKFPLSSAVVMGAESRIVFGIPRHEMVIVGTTDTDFKGHPGEVVATAEDIRYVLGVIQEYFPGARITKEDIVASYAGVRPLVADGSSNEGKTSREHTILSTSEGITFVAGGKYTTYRLMCEQTVDECLTFFPMDLRTGLKDCETSRSLNPKITQGTQAQKDQAVIELTQKTSWNQQQAETLFDRHGLEIFDLLNDFGFLLSPVQIEARHAIKNTMCLHLVDFFARRMPLFLALKDHGFSLRNEIGEVFAQELSWSSEELKNEQKKLDEYAAHELSWKVAL